MVIDDDQVVEEVVDNEEEVIEESETSVEESDEEAPENDQESEDEEEDRVVTIGDPDPEEEKEHTEAPGWVKNVRKINRKLESESKLKDRKIAELEAKLNGATEKKPVELGKEPTLESAGYDDRRFKEEYAAWTKRKLLVEAQEEEAKERVKARQASLQEKAQTYVNKKQEHGFRDFDEAEALVSTTLTPAQQQIIVERADDSALVVYALGKNTKKLDELAEVDDPIEFAVKMAKVEAQLKVRNKKAPAPEKRVKAASGMTGSADRELERLRAEAEKSGDYSKVTAYKRKLREG